MPQGLQIEDILREALSRGATDIHMVANTPIMLRINGELYPMHATQVFDQANCTRLLLEMLNEAQRALLEKEWSVDFMHILDESRFRVNITLQRYGMEAVFRSIRTRIPTPEELMIPPSVIRMMDSNRGLILVTGPCGSGKSTTLACLVDVLNQTRRAKIITIEDPIEYIHTNKNSFVSQREIGLHSPSFEAAMRYVLRQDPNVVLIGEMRDDETIAAALLVADTGHLVLATLHAVDAPQAVDRIIDSFPGHQQAQIRAQLAATLRGVVAQTLLPRSDGQGRIAGFEILMNTQAVAAMIRQGRTHEIPNAIEMGINEGMKTMTRSMQELAKAGMIDPSLLPASNVSPFTSRPGSAPRKG